MKPVVIVDTDIGGDIDDSWALLYLLKLRMFDVKLVVNAYGCDNYRLRIASKILDLAGETAVLGRGATPPREDWEHMPIAEWLGGYYKKLDFAGGITEMERIVRESPEPVNIVCIGGLTNIAALFRRYPKAVGKTVLYLMAGNLVRSDDTETPRVSEANINMDIKSARYVFSKNPNVVLCPFNPSKDIIIGGDNYRRLLSSEREDVKELLRSYYMWEEKWISYFPSYPARKDRESSSLYDVMPVFLLAADYDKNLVNPVEFENIPVKITAEGYTLIEEGGLNVRCGMRINNMDVLTDHVTDVLLR